MNIPPHFQTNCLITWLSCYAAKTPGLEALADVPVQLERGGEMRLDALLRVKESAGGQTEVHGNQVVGTPEFGAKVGDFCDSTWAKEFLDTEFFEFFEWKSNSDCGGGLHTIPSDTNDVDGYYCSHIFPGLAISFTNYNNCHINAIVADVRNLTGTRSHRNLVEDLQFGSWPPTADDEK